jgi:hypothetical protein
MITFKPIESYYTDDDKAVIDRTAQLVTARERRQTELAELDFAIAHQGEIAPDQDDQVQNLIAGIETPRATPLSEKRTALQQTISDLAKALDFMAGKQRGVTMCTGGLHRRVSHDRHFNAASSFQIGVSRGRRTASSGMLALVSHLWHFTSSQP